MKNMITQHKKKFLAAATFLVLGCLTLLVSTFSENNNTEIAYRETEVKKGELTVGIEASGSVEIGTQEQTFDLDLSKYVSSSSGSGNVDADGMPAGGAEMGGMGFGGGQGFLGLAQAGSASSGDSNTLTILESCVTEGEKIEAGDVIYRLTDDSILDIREQLVSDVRSAKADLDILEAENKISAVSAKNTYDISSAYGSYAGQEYDQSIYTAEKQVTDLEKEVAEYEEDLAKRQEELALLREEFSMVSETAEAFKWSVDHMDISDETALYLDYENQRETAQRNADSLESSIEQAETMIENVADQLEDLNTQLAQARRELESTKLSAEQTRQLHLLSYRASQEAYDVTTGYLAYNYEKQQNEYTEVQEKLDEFDSVISENTIVAQYSGIVTDLPLEPGDPISTGTSLITVYDEADTTITVPVDETDIRSLEEGGSVNISFTAYPDTIFRGTITEIGDAETDSDGNTTRPVTVSVSGDVSGLYAGMTGDLTFITRETEEVLYVSNRAIFRDGTRSYVKVRDNGSVTEKDIVTGFSDGENAEIREGLSEGDVVLIESRVNS